MYEHAAIGDELLALLSAELDPIERSSLANGLAAARATSTVSRLYRGASAAPQSPSPVAIEGDGDEAAIDDVLAGSATAEPEAQLAGKGGSGRQADVNDVAPITVARSSHREMPARRPDERAAVGSVLVGVDGSPAAGAALEWAVRFASSVGAEIVVANVFEPPQAELPPDDYARLVADAEHRLREEWSAPLRGTGVRYRCLQLTGTPDSLLAATRAAGADLLVVGTRGAGRHAALHLGSLAHHLAHYTRGPLAIVPAAGAERRVDRIVLGVDGSSGSAAAVRWCAAIASASDAEVAAVCAFDSNTRWGFGDDAESWRATAEQAISAEWIAPLRATGVVTRCRIVEGRRPLAALEGAAHDEDAGLFVVGTRGLSEVAGLRLGRLPLQLVHHTHLPVVLVPTADHG
jgi:nucleotide-binding universal stress UspA family protein